MVNHVGRPSVAGTGPDDAPRVVAVIGNGPVGQTTALLLARWRVPVVLLDRRPGRDPVGSKAICQQRDVLDVWAAAGAGEQIADEGVTWTTSRTFHHDEELFATTFVDRGSSPFPPFVNISQSRTEEILDACVRAEPLVDVRWNHRVVAVDQDVDRVRLTCRRPDGTTTGVDAAYAVVCAGARSDDLRAALGLTFDGRTFDDQFLICDIRADIPDWVTERRFYFDPVWNPGRQVLIHPCPDSTFRIDWQVPPGYDVDDEERTGALDRRIRQVIGDRPYEVVWRSVYRFHSRVVDRMRVGRVLVAGDCAHLVSPFGARGLNSGVQDAENAAWKLAFVLRGWAPESLLDTYDDERRAAALENIEVTTATMDFLVPRSAEQAAHRAATLDRASSDPEARAKVDSGRLAEPYWYVDSPLTTPDPRRPFTGRPPRGHTPPPGPGVLVPDVPVGPGAGGATRLREIVRAGLLVLTGSGIDATAVRSLLVPRTAAPVRVLGAGSLDTDASPTVSTALGIRPDERWLIRPDGHIAAVTTDDDSLLGAVRRLLADHDRSNKGTHMTSDRHDTIGGHAGPVSTSGPEFEAAIAVWNRARPRRPALVAHCSSTGDVVAALAYARGHGLPVAARSGGHSYTGASVVGDGVVLDLRAMDDVSYDAGEGLVRVGGGATWAAVDDVLGPAGVATAGGSVSKVGVAGFSLGTGFGWLGRTYGTAGDNLVEASVVLADGSVVRAAQDENPDLFWALRGGCGNFGIVTEFRFRTHPVGTVLAGPVVYRVQDAAVVLRALASGAADLDRRASWTAVLTTAPPVTGIPADMVGRAVLLLPLLWVGDPEEGAAYLAPLRRLAEPVADLVAVGPYSAFQRQTDDAAPDGMCWDVRSEWLDDLDGASIQAAVDSALTMTSPLSELLFRTAGGALAALPASTPFSFGHARYLLEVIANWSPGEDPEPARAWMRKAYAGQVHTSSGGVCVNHIGFDEGPERVRAAYSTRTYTRLRGIKRRYDPENLFRSVQNIAP
jgi:2-polyprenyl-6-methoxyphenol hydroxylase-like FAD-dependent oxidoreductase/FAD/FMN-containing dehydrogenase